MKSYTEKLEEYAISLGLTSKDIPVVLSMASFHSCGRCVRKRNDTGEYIYCQYESSECDYDDDKFGAYVISPEQYEKYKQERHSKVL